jgi:hypothetical protein
MPSPRRSSGITLQSFYAANISASRNPRHRIHQILPRTTAHRSDRLTMQPDRPSFDHNPLLAAKLARNLAAVNRWTIRTYICVIRILIKCLRRLAQLGPSKLLRDLLLSRPVNSA